MSTTVAGPPLDDVAALAEAIMAAEADGSGASPALDRADSLLQRLRDAFRSLSEGERGDLARLVTPLRARRDALLGGRARAVPGPWRPLDDVVADLGAHDLRPGQRPAMLAGLAGRDALVVMATGSGKSLCYQAPALAMPGLTIVVSPLIALIADQHDRLRRAGHPVRMLTSVQSPDDQREALAALRAGGVRLVFCAPERLGQGAFLDSVTPNRVELMAVDEAHCLAEWGHDFRPEYLRLAALRERLAPRATMALTATATPAVAREIGDRLGLRDPLLVRGGFDRPNISFDVVSLAGAGSVARKWDHLVAGLRGPDGVPAIVYCGTRREVDDVAAGLVARGVRAVAYHAGLPAGERTRAQDAFMGGEAEVVAATTAFGMGVDKADVRAVWHWSIPTSLEGYYQEAGRAGRDGRPARAVLLAMRADLGRLIHFATRDRAGADDVQSLVSRLAGETGPGGVFALDRDRLAERDRLCLALAERVGAVELMPGQGGQVLGAVRTSYLDDAQRGAAEAAAKRALDRRWAGYRAITGYAGTATCRRAAVLRHFGDAPAAAPTGRCCDVCDPLPSPPPAAGPAPRAAARAPDADDPPVDESLFSALRDWRRERADGKPAYTVCADRALRQIAARPPSDAAALAAVHGIGPTFMDRHGESLLELLARSA